MNHLSKEFATCDNSATVNTEICSIKQFHLTEPDYAQQPWSKTVRCDSVYNEMILKGLFLKGTNR